MSSEIVKKIKDRSYLIIPVICLSLWMLYSWIYKDFNLTRNDFTNFYEGGQEVFSNPSDIYYPKGLYTYMPVVAAILSVTLSPLPHITAQYIFNLLNLFLGALFLMEYDKILKIMGVEKKIQRFLFLILISNGLVVYVIFYENHWKFMVGLILLYIMRIEMQERISNETKTLKDYIIRYGLFTLVVGIVPPFIFLLLIYVLQDIPINEILKWENIKKYCIVILWFAIQNFLFFIYPFLLFDFLSLFFLANTEGFAWFFYLREWVFMGGVFSVISLILIIVVLIFTLVMILNKTLTIEKKIIFSCLFYIVFYTLGQRSLYLLLAISLLLFVPYLNKDTKGFDFIRKNFVLIIGLLSVSAIFFMPSRYTFNKYFPSVMNSPLVIIVNLRWILLLVVFYSSYILLYLRNRK